MKTMYLISIFLILVGLGCDDTKKEISQKDLIGIWELIQIEEQDENDNWIQTEIPDPESDCLINLEFKNDGRFYGNTCSNKFFGNYEIHQSDDRISANNVGGTKAGDTKWGFKYTDYFGIFTPYTISLSYSILSDTLTISGNKFKIIFKSSNQ